MSKLTQAQQRAVDEQAKTLLVSAAAGSGKTTTLIRRILTQVTRTENPVMLDRLLIVTFTKAAASELRLRISAALSDAIAEAGESELLAEQIALLPSAKISTIDSFCLDLVRANYASLGLSPSFRIADPGETALLTHEVMEHLIDKCYDDPQSTLCGGPDGFAHLVDTLLGAANDKSLADLLISLYEKLSAYPRGATALHTQAEELRKYADNDFFESPFGKRIEAHLRGMLHHYKHSFKVCMEKMEQDAALRSSYYITFSEDYEKICAAEKALADGYTAGRESFLAIDFPQIKRFQGERTPFVNRVKEHRDNCKADIRTAQSRFFNVDTAQIRAAMLETAGICHALGDLLCAFETMLEAEKKRKNLCDFSDLSRYTLRLLVDENGADTAFAHAQKQLFDAVYIDEYQDVNAVQDRIFAAISTETNRFMVGDIKQSIYAFRGAEPSIFADLRYTYPPIDEAAASDNATIFMSENFRCGKEIIDFTNAIFDTLMPLISPDMHYTNADALVFKKSETPEPPIPVQIVLAEKPPKNAPDKDRNTEAEYIAKEILSLTRDARKADGTPIGFDDIAILIRSPKARIDEFSEALCAKGIPVYTETNENLLEQSEVAILLCFLEMIDNPRRDIALAGALLSPLCGLDCDTLAAIRHGVKGERLITTLRAYQGSAKPQIDAFLEKAAEFRRMARFMSAGELIDRIYAEFGVFARLCGGDALRRANLEKFHQVAAAFSKSDSGSLSAFLRYLRAIDDNSKAQLTAAKAGVETHGAVRIMSVHQSKGLEYPVVFFANTASPYNLRDASNALLYNHAAGFGLRLRDTSGFCAYDTLLRQSVSLAEKRASKEEELRLLYVALTRARERLYMTAMVSDPEKTYGDMEFESHFLTEFSALAERDHLSLALLAIQSEEKAFVTLHKQPYLCKAAQETDAADAEETVIADAEDVRCLQERFDFRYLHTARTKIPAKLSISRLYPDILDDVILDEVISEERLPALVKAPRFIAGEENEAAKRGTATHLFMQFFDFAYAKEHGAAAELARLTEKRFLTAEDAALVSLDEVENFLHSALFTEMCTAKRIYREQRFNLTLPADDFATDTGLKAELKGETVLVQGVIDCFYYDANGNIVLVDYKTDRLPSDRAAAEEKLRKAHTRQLSYYAKAIREICGEAPKHCLIYSLCMGDTVSV